MAELMLNILGFPAVNHDLTVELRDPSTNEVVTTARPFLDGSVRVPRIDAGAYEVLVRHPNLAIPVIRRPLRVLPGRDTRISLVIDPADFRNTPITDIPDANLAPVRQMTQSVAETLSGVATKRPGEAIRADDWNAMASGIKDLAHAVAELTRLVTPTGHNHPEFVTKFDEVSGNFTQLLNTLSAAMAEIQRQLQAQRFRKQIEDVALEAELDEDRKRDLLGVVDELERHMTSPPDRFARMARTAGVELAVKLDRIIEDRPGELVGAAPVVALTQSTDLLKGARAVTYGSELEQHRKADRTFGVGALTEILPRK